MNISTYRESAVDATLLGERAEAGALSKTSDEPLKATAENCARACTAGSGKKTKLGFSDPQIIIHKRFNS